MTLQTSELLTSVDAPTDTTPDTAVEPLAGFTVAVTANRRREELGALLERRGAKVIYAPALRIVSLPDDTQLRQITRECIERPLDIMVATTAIGFRGWMEAADGWGFAGALNDQLADTRIIARGPKVTGAIRAAGLKEEWSPASESMSEVLDHLLSKDLAGLRVGMQLHGEPLPDAVEALEAAGADVVQISVYRWLPPQDIAPLDRLVEQVVAGSVDIVTFTSAPAVLSLLRQSTRAGQLEQVLAAFHSEVSAACVGPVTSAPLERQGVPVVVPERSRLGGLVREISDSISRRHRVLPVAGHRIQVRGHAAVVDGELRPVPAASMVVLKALAQYPGRVLTREELLTRMPNGEADGHAVEMAVARLRTALGTPKAVQTVVKRGYRLAYDPESATDHTLETHG